MAFSKEDRLLKAAHLILLAPMSEIRMYKLVIAKDCRQLTQVMVYRGIMASLYTIT